MKTLENTVSTRLAVAFTALLLSACGSEMDTTSCKAIGDSYIKDPEFSTLFASRKDRQWHTSQHAGDKSFELTVEGGVLDITKTGTEPWTIVTQSLDVKPLKGKTVAFTADLKLDLKPPKTPHGFKLGGGLTLSAKRNGKLVLRTSFDHEPHMGTSDWRPVQVILKIPPKVDALRLGVIHQAGGNLQVRNPSLRVIDTADGSCTLTPLEK